MTNVWWMGTGKKIMSVRDWAQVGVSGVTVDTIWELGIGWAVDESTLNAGQLAWLSINPDFLVNQTGPRALPPEGGPYPPAANPAEFYFRAMKTLYDTFVQQGNVSPEQVQAAITTLIGSAGTDFDTLGELASAVSNKLDKIVGNTIIYSNSASGIPSSLPYSSAPSVNYISRWTPERNLMADNFIISAASAVTSGGTSTQTLDSAGIIFYTGTLGHTHVLPTTGITLGYGQWIVNNGTGTITINASNGNFVLNVQPGHAAFCIAQIATPTSLLSWAYLYISNLPHRTSPNANTVAMRDASANLFASTFVPSFSTQATAGGTTVLTNASAQEQEFTGTLAQTITLPTSGIPAGYPVVISSKSSGTLTINASAGALARQMFNGDAWLFVARIANPTVAADWAYRLLITIPFSQSASVGSIVQRNGQADIQADSFVASSLSIATSAGSTALTVDSVENIDISGNAVHTFVLPSTSVLAGKPFMLWNNATQTVTVNASDGTLVRTIVAGGWMRVAARQATPITNTHWNKTN